MSEDISQLQFLQQNMQQVVMQRQQFQMQLNMISSALEEIAQTPQAYKIIGGIMVAVDKEKLKKELVEKKDMLDLRIKNLEKQEERLTKKTEETQKKVMESLKKK